MGERNLSRRRLIGQAIGLAALPLACGRKSSSARDAAVVKTPDAKPPEKPIVNPFPDLEKRVGGRLGVCVFDTESKAVIGHRADERFGMCSTFKVLLAATILREADAGRLALSSPVRFTKADMVPYAPVTSKNLARGWMTIEELAETAQKTSDNVAANLLLKQIGGPAGFTRLLRESGDNVTRLDRWEPEMNLVGPDEVRDTTTPQAMAESVARFVVGDILSAPSKARLKGWMAATKTGRKRLRHGLPADWPSGNKTGTGIAEGIANKTNDVAVVYPPGKSPRVIAAYYESDGYYPKIRPEDQEVLAEVGRLAARLI